MGDSHGAAKAIEQCLERCGFNRDEDILIHIGDITDGWPETKRSIDLLLEIKKLVLIMGNHDYWLLEWFQTGKQSDIWLDQGGRAAVKSYDLPYTGYGSIPDVPKEHVELLKKAVPYHVIGARVFVHAGLDLDLKLKEQDRDLLMWDRKLLYTAAGESILHNGQSGEVVGRWHEIFVGHTSIAAYSLEPKQFGQVIALDTGAGWEGKLTIMEIITKEFWQSELVSTLYPNLKG